MPCWPRKLFTLAFRELEQGRDLPQHAHRMYFSGSNDFGDPLVLATVPHPSLLPFVFESAYAEFAKEMNDLAAMPLFGWQSLLYYVLRIVCYPLAYRFRKVWMSPSGDCAFPYSVLCRFAERIALTLCEVLCFTAITRFCGPASRSTCRTNCGSQPLPILLSLTLMCCMTNAVMLKFPSVNLGFPWCYCLLGTGRTPTRTTLVCGS